MSKYITIIILQLALYGGAEAQFGNLLDKAKESAAEISKIGKDLGSGNGDALDIASGLKEALNKGVSSAVTSLSADNGYLSSPYKILIPEDAQKVVGKLKMVPGFTDVEDQLISKINAAAEIAAKESAPIFVNAIKGMTIADAKSILFGNNDAATKYLESSSRKELYSTFMPIIQNALQQVNATKYWNGVVTKYNKLPLTKDMNPDLDDHVNNKALDGLFGLIEVKESGIRDDVSQRTSPLLMDVFGELDKK